MVANRFQPAIDSYYPKDYTILPVLYYILYCTLYYTVTNEITFEHLIFSIPAVPVE